jgi:hypothetical protein
MPSNVLAIVLVAELWSVIFWCHAGFYAYKAKKKLILAEERENMIFGNFGGTYHVCTEKRDICIREGCNHQRVFPVLVIVICYLKSCQEINKLVNIGI